MKKRYLGLLAFALILTGVYHSSPDIARWLFERWLVDQGFEHVELDIRHPDFDQITIDTISLSKSDTNQRITLKAHNLNIRFALPQMLMKQRLKQIIASEVSITQQRLASAPNNESIHLPPVIPAHLITKFPADRMLIGHLQLTQEESNHKLHQIQGAVDLNNQELISRLAIKVGQHSLGWTDLYFDKDSNFSIKQTHNDKELVNLTGHIELLNDRRLAITTQYRLQTPDTQSWINAITSEIGQLQLKEGRAKIVGKGSITLPPTIDPKTLQLKQQLHLLVEGELRKSGQFSSKSNIEITVADGKLELEITNASLTTDLNQLAIQPAPQVTAELDQVLSLKAPLDDIQQFTASATRLKINHSTVTHPKMTLLPSQWDVRIDPISWPTESFGIDINSDRIQLKDQHYTYPILNLSSNFTFKEPGKFGQTFVINAPSLPIKITGYANHSKNDSNIHWKIQPIELGKLNTKKIPGFNDFAKELVFLNGQLTHSGNLIRQNDDISFQGQQRLENLALEWNKTRIQNADIKIKSKLSSQGLMSEHFNFNIGLLTSGVPIEQINGSGTFYHRPSTNRWTLKTEPMSAQLLGGKVKHPAITLSQNTKQVHALLNVEHLQLEKLLELEQQPGLAGKGQLSGSLPMLWQDNQLMIRDGKLDALKPGGWIRYQPTDRVAAMIKANPQLALAVDALSNFQYHQLQIGIDLQANGDTTLETQLKGHNPDWNQGHPINLNLNLEENLYQLLKALQFTEKLTQSIENRYRNANPNQ